MTQKSSYIYILTNQHNNIFYVGVSSDLQKRIWQHKNKSFSGFTEKYKLYKLVYYEISDDISSSILREKEIKSKKRAFKITLIENFNPVWEDLYSRIFQ
jgi:putative endonuclease